MSTDVCLMGQETSDIIQGLKESLKGRVNCVDYFKSESDVKSSVNYNTVVCIHDKEMSQENQMLRLGSVLDLDRQVCCY